MSVCQFDCKIYETVITCINLEEIAVVLYLPQEVQSKHKQKLTVSIARNVFDYSMGIHTITLRNTLDGITTAIEALLVFDDANKHLKPTVQVALMNGGTDLHLCSSGYLAKKIPIGNLRIFICVLFFVKTGNQ